MFLVVPHEHKREPKMMYSSAGFSCFFCSGTGLPQRGVIYLTMSIGQTSLAGKNRAILIRKYYRKEDKKIITFPRM